MKIIIGSDHAAFEAKKTLTVFLRELGHEVIDAGTNGTASCDYPDYAQKVAAAVAGGACERGVLLCGTGIGMSITANKVKGIRAGLCHDILTARLSRRHNNANVLCMGARIMGEETIKETAREFLATPFEGGRHARRVAKIAAMEG